MANSNPKNRKADLLTVLQLGKLH